MYGRPRVQPGPAAESVTHPLLLDPASAAARAAQSRSGRRATRNFIAAGLNLANLDEALGEGAAALIQDMLAHARPVGSEALHINVPPNLLNSRGARGGAISASIRLERVPRAGDTRLEGRSLDPLLTTQRWTEEAKMLNGKFETTRVNRLSNHVTLALLPTAAEAYKRAKEAEEKEQERLREELSRAAEEAAKKEQEAIEAAEKAKQEEEARAAEAAAEAAATAAATAAAAAAATATASTEGAPSSDADVEMSDATEADPTGADLAGPSNDPETVGGSTGQTEAVTPPVARVTVMIHGNPVDITDTGIDPTFLEALPDDMREEVLNQHVRDQRAAQVERPADSQISAEFLDALPPDIRAEIIQQEAAERAQRTRAEQVLQQNGPSEIDPASFIASLDPQLRQVVLMDSDEVFIQSLPSHMIAEANIHREHGRPSRARHAVIPAAQDVRGAQSQPTHPTKPPQPRDAIQLLDKSALAALVRLLFYPQILKKSLLYKVLVNLCENAKSRTDLFTLLLSILQDSDLASMDKSFAQMSVRHSTSAAPQTPKSVGKRRATSDYFGSLSLPQNDVVPELVVQRCLEALAYIVTSNELSSLFFLTEHELPLGLRRSSSKKGKGKEKQVPQTHYPIVLLLSLLERPSILRTPSIVESVVNLLANVTRPLASLKDHKKSDPEGTSTTDPDAGPTAAPVPTDAPAQQPASVEEVPSQPTQPTDGKTPLVFNSRCF